jgi:hypothetical protein
MQGPLACLRPRSPARARSARWSWRARSAPGVLVLAALAVLSGCGSTLRATPAAHVAADPDPTPASAPSSCSTAVLATLTSVLERVYREGVHSERTASAEYLITHSTALRAAVEHGDRRAARAAALMLLKTGHLTNVTVRRANQTLVDVGGPALAPLHGELAGASGAPIAHYITSVWADEGFLAESGGITQGLIALRANGRIVADSPHLPPGALPDAGTLTGAGVTYRYTSFPVEAYPSGAMRVYVLMAAPAIARLCGPTPQGTQINTLQRVAVEIYNAEIGHKALAQVRRVQRNSPLLQAVAHREPEAARLAIDALLNQHIVRLRVSTAGQLLSDVGGPYVLGPVSAPLRLGGQQIGSLTLSIQDDEGYLRLARRLAGLDVLMYENPAHPQLVKDSLGPMPGPALAAVPASGPFRYHGRSFDVFTIHAQAFPSGGLVIRVLIPLPYG